MINCIIAGVGGQGTVLLSRLIGAAAMQMGLIVRGTETIGMAQRGGCVVSHVRMGKQIHSPLIPEGGADVIIAFEPGEAVRATPFLASDGVMVVCDRAIRPVTSSLSTDGYEARTVTKYLEKNINRLILIDGEALISRCGSAKVINVALLGAAVKSDVFPFGRDHVEHVLKKRLPEKFHAVNLKALEIGEDMAIEQMGGEFK